MFKLIRSKLDDANLELGKTRGEALMRQAQDEDLVMLWPIAPNGSSSIIMGNTSPSIEPFRGTHTVRTHLAVRISTKISIWTISSKIKLKRIRNWIMRRFGRV